MKSYSDGGGGNNIRVTSDSIGTGKRIDTCEIAEFCSPVADKAVERALGSHTIFSYIFAVLFPYDPFGAFAEFMIQKLNFSVSFLKMKFYFLSC